MVDAIDANLLLTGPLMPVPGFDVPALHPCDDGSEGAALKLRTASIRLARTLPMACVLNNWPADIGALGRKSGRLRRAHD